MLERYGHGGDLRTAAEAFGRSRESFLDFSSNMNPFGPPEGVRRVLSGYADEIVKYPDPGVRELTAKLAKRYDVPEASIVVGNGAAEMIDLLIRVLKPRCTALVRPSFSEYEEAVHKIGGNVVDIPLREKDGFELQWSDVEQTLDQADVYVFGHPNNPTGRLLPEGIVSRLLTAGKTVVLDEAFIDFAPDEDKRSLIRAAALDHRLIVIRSMTKFFAVPGIRLGFLVAHQDWVKRVKEQQVTWSVNSLAQAIGCEVLDDKPYVGKTKAWLAEERPWLMNRLESAGLRVYSSDTNFLLLRFSGVTIKDVQAAMGRKGVLIRDASLFSGLDESFARAAIRTRSENEELVNCLIETLEELGANKGKAEADSSAGSGNRAVAEDSLIAADQLDEPPHAGHTLMLQGTSSDVGKSLLTAGLCRIFTQDGKRVAPFKSQNMSLNSYVTPDGKEIGRAQGMQADACRIPATTDMNPILLKPSREMTSQVVVHGKPLANMDARSYRESWLPKAETIVREALGRLRELSDLVIIEGAGSPAEVNLKNRDIVNMRLAGWADAPVLLVADIDRGGVFASIVGTLDILTPEERERVKGFIINKFRGDVTLLKPGLDWLEHRTGKPVIGVIPFLPDIGLEDEDSASLAAKLANQGSRQPREDQLDIVVIHLPYLSNFTDFDPLPEEPDVSLRYVRSPEQFGKPDVVLIPGSKNTVDDLRFLQENGLADRIFTHTVGGGFLTGICAGYQMMGLRLLDPDHVESEFGDIDGLGLFPAETTFTQEKKTEQVMGAALDWYDAGTVEMEGYEIHMGQTRFLEQVFHPFSLRLCRSEEEREAYHPDGAVSPDGRVWGTYVHGILHNDQLRRSWLNQVRAAKGWEPLPVTFRFRERRETAFNRLADHVRRHLDMKLLYEMIQ